MSYFYTEIDLVLCLLTLSVTHHQGYPSNDLTTGAALVHKKIRGRGSPMVPKSDISGRNCRTPEP